METDIMKQLRIKSGAVKRINREYHSYEEELGQERQRMEKMRTEGASDYTIKKQQDVIQETISMLPNSKKRLQDAVEDLQAFLTEHSANADLAARDEWTDAQTQVQTALSGVLNVS